MLIGLYVNPVWIFAVRLYFFLVSIFAVKLGKSLALTSIPASKVCFFSFHVGKVFLIAGLKVKATWYRNFTFGANLKLFFTNVLLACLQSPKLPFGLRTPLIRLSRNPSKSPYLIL